MGLINLREKLNYHIVITLNIYAKVFSIKQNKLFISLKSSSNSLRIDLGKYIIA